MQSKLDFDAAIALLSQTGEEPVVDFERWLRDNYPTLFVLEAKEHSGRFNVNFSRPGLHPFVHRLTGGCGNLESKYWHGLQNLMDALRGYDPRGLTQPKMEGLGLFGGTRMLFKRDPKVVRPGVTEVFPSIASETPGAIMLGIVARYSKMFYTEHGLVIGTEPEKDFFTIVHPTQKAIALIQENADEVASIDGRPAPWDVEYLRSADIVGELQEGGFGTLLTAYGGGGVTKKEVELWAKLSKQVGDPQQWRTLLIRDSGGVADVLGQDKNWLKENPNVHTCGCSTEEIRQALTQLGAVVEPRTIGAMMPRTR